MEVSMSRMVSYCSFCGNADYEVTLVIERNDGTGICICDSCVITASKALYLAGIVTAPLVTEKKLSGRAMYVEKRRYSYRKSLPKKPPD
jgi:hypothetical protein